MGASIPPGPCTSRSRRGVMTTRAFVDNGTTQVVRGIETNLFQVRVSGLPAVESAQMVGVDLDDDGVTDLVLIDPTTQSMSLP